MKPTTILACMICVVFALSAVRGNAEEKQQESSAPVQQAKDDKTDAVSLSYHRLPSFYQQRDEKGILGPPAARVNFGDNARQDVTVTAMVRGTTIVCPLIYQDVAYVLDKEGKRGKRIPIFGYQGCPFTIDGPIQVTRDFEMREEITIEIEKASGSILWVSSKSARPLSITGMSIATGCEMFIGTTWVFKSKGTELVADGQKFATEKDGATVKFTKIGMVMDGVSKKDDKDSLLSVIWPFGSKGFICQYLVPYQTTNLLRNFFEGLAGGCRKQE